MFCRLTDTFLKRFCSGLKGFCLHSLVIKLKYCDLIRYMIHCLDKSIFVWKKYYSVSINLIEDVYFTGLKCIHFKTNCKHKAIDFFAEAIYSVFSKFIICKTITILQPYHTVTLCLSLSLYKNIIKGPFIETKKYPLS